MKTRIIKYTLYIFCMTLINVQCEKDPSHNKSCWQIDKNFLLKRVITNNKYIQEFIYNDNKQLIRINYSADDSVYNFETFEYSNEGRLSRRDYIYGYFETYEYDETGRYIKKKMYTNEGDLSEITEFIYNSQGMIEKAESSYPDYDDLITYLYSYDSKGNVIRVTEEPMFYAEFEYDDMKNPRFNWDLPNDIIQYNNPVKYFVYNPISCSMPPNYRYEYEYNTDGYPVTEYKIYVSMEIADTLQYEYLD